MKKTIALLLILLLGTFAAESYAVSEAGVLFLMISPGARAAGMGEAFVAIADDATAVYWNPAGLAFQTGREIVAMHTNWLPGFGSDLYYDFLAYRQNLEGVGVIAGNITYLNLGEQTHTDADGTELGKFNSHEFAVTVAVGAKISENMAVGLGLRYIRSSLSGDNIQVGSEKGSGKANAFAVDIGWLYKAGFLRGLSFGANLSNLGPKIAYIDAAQADPLPTNLRVGLAYKAVDTEFNRLSFALDFNKLLVVRHKDGTSDPFLKALVTAWSNQSASEELKDVIIGVGVEYWYSNLIALRTGYHVDEAGKANYATFGFAIKYSLYRFDFGYVATGDEGHPLSGTSRFALTIGF
jgi:hypothetical protein